MSSEECRRTSASLSITLSDIIQHPSPTHRRTCSAGRNAALPCIVAVQPVTHRLQLACAFREPIVAPGIRAATALFAALPFPAAIISLFPCDVRFHRLARPQRRCISASQHGLQHSPEISLSAVAGHSHSWRASLCALTALDRRHAATCEETEALALRVQHIVPHLAVKYSSAARLR